MKNRNLLPGINEDELKLILARIKKHIEIGLLARNPRFLDALDWEVSDEELSVDAGGGRGDRIARRSPPASGDSDL